MREILVRVPVSVSAGATFTSTALRVFAASMAEHVRMQREIQAAFARVTDGFATHLSLKEAKDDKKEATR